MMEREVMIRLCNASFLAMIAVGFVAVSLSHAAVFYVDPKGGDIAGDGSAERPWETIQQVFERNLIQTHDKTGRLKNPDAPVKAGDTILLRSGYHGEIYCRGAYNDDYITIAAEQGHKPKVRRIFFSTAGKWIIRGLKVSPAFAPDYKRDRLIYVVDWGGPSSDFVIENNTLCSSKDAHRGRLSNGTNWPAMAFPLLERGSRSETIRLGISITVLLSSAIKLPSSEIRSNISPVTGSCVRPTTHPCSATA